MTFLAILKIFTGIPSGPVAFLGFRLSYLYLQLLLLESQNLELHFDYI